MRLFKENSFLKKIFFIELILIFSGVSSFFILAYVKKDVPFPSESSPRKYRESRMLLDNYRILAYFLGLPDSMFTPKEGGEEISDEFIAGIVHVQAAESLLKEKKYSRAETILASLQSPHDFLEEKIAVLYLKTLYFQQRFREFLNRYKSYPLKDNLQIQLLRINCLTRINETNAEEEAFKIFRRLFLQNRLKPFRDYISSRTLSGFLKKLSYDDWYQKFNYLARGNYYSEFRLESPYIKAPQLHNLFYAEFNYKRRRYSEVQRYLGSVKSPQLLNHKKKLLFKIELRRKNLGPRDIHAELDELKDDVALYAEVLFDAAGILLIQRELDLSLSIFSKYIDLIETDRSLSKNDSNYWKALWLSAWIHFREGRKADALKFFEKGLRAPGDTYRSANTYWYHRLKRSDAARPVSDFSFSYYYVKTRGPYAPGRVSHKDRGLQRFISLINGAQSPLFLQLVENLKTLLGNGKIDESFDFVRWAKRSTKLSRSERNVFKIIESIFYLKKKDFYHTFVTFRNNFDCYQCLRPPKFLSGIYSPVKYLDLIETYSKRYRLDRNLVLGLIREESFFRPKIISPARANGLMQLLFGTARQVAARQGKKIQRWDLYTPHINISLGTDHLRELLDKYDDKLHLVLAAYNAGSHRVDSWLRQFGDVPDDQFIEMIPFTETRGYVKNILRNYYYYRFYYGEQ